MSEFVISYKVAYEGITEVLQNTLEEVVDWIEHNKSTYEWNWDNLTLRGPAGDIDVYELMGRARAGLPLVDPDYAQAESAMLRVLSDFQNDRIGDDTLAVLDALRELVVRRIEAAKFGEEVGAPPGAAEVTSPRP